MMLGSFLNSPATVASKVAIFADFRTFELASRAADASERGALATAIGKGCEAGWCLWPSFRHWARCAQNPFVLVDYGRQETPKAPCLTKM